jgi:hypothetical protein
MYSVNFAETPILDSNWNRFVAFLLNSFEMIVMTLSLSLTVY